MRNLLLVLFLTIFSTATFANDQCAQKWEQKFDLNVISDDYFNMLNNCDHDLVVLLYKRVTSKPKALNYDQARFVMFTELDMVDEKVCSVYDKNHCVKNYGDVPSANQMNTEHTWPKSKGAKNLPAKSDLHHLYPASKRANGKRASHPFCEVVKPVWQKGGSLLGRSIHNYGNCFEPPESHKGNVARALFYFSIRYQLPIDKEQEDVLREWHKLDPVDSKDILRNLKISEYQNNTNPFIDQPYLVDLISDF